MAFLQKRRLQIAVLFQVVFVCFILFGALPAASPQIQIKIDSKSLLCISSGSAVVVREASEPLLVALSFIQNKSLREKSWLCAEGIQSSKVLTNTALEISNRVYNTFYEVTTIHAP